MRRRVIIGAAAIGAAALAAVLWRRPISTAVEPRSQRHLLGAAATSSTPAAIGNCSAPANGAHRRYSLQMSSEIKASQAPILQFKLSGFWDTTVLDTAAGNTVLRVTVDEAKFESETRADSDELEAMQRGFAQPLYLTIDAGGHISETRKTAAMPAVVEQMVSYIAAAPEFVCSKRAEAKWEADEVDPTGRYHAIYERKSERRVLKSKTSYLEGFGIALSGPAPRIHVDVLSSRVVFRFDGLGELSGLSFDEHTRVSGDGPLPGLESTNRIELALVSNAVVAVDESELQQARALPPSRAQQRPVESASATLDTTHARTGGLSLAEVLLRLRSVGDDAKQERARLFVALAAVLGSDPAAVTDAVSRIARHDPDTRTLIDALGSAGSAEAQAGLRQAASNAQLEQSTRKDALIALSLIRTPTAETVTWLTGLTHDEALGRQARYALGNATYQSAASSPDRAKVATDALLALLKENDNPANLVETLTALGAAGSRAALPFIVPLTRSGDPSVRAAAVYSLRRITGDDVDRILALAVAADPIQLVRERAIDAAKQRDFSTSLAAGLQSAAVSDQSVSVRYHAIEALIRWARSSRSVLPTLQWSASNESNETVRRLAMAAVQSLEQSG